MADHHTGQYKWSTPVFRRGFQIAFLSPCDDSNQINTIGVNLKTGRVLRGNQFKEYKVRMGYDVAGWTVQYGTTNRRNNVTIYLNPPPNAIVGHYVAQVYINGRMRKNLSFLLLFNPWCPDDLVFMDDESMRWEYIQNTHTIIYMGTSTHITPRGWYLAQFQSYSIEAMLSLLDRMPVEDRSSPVKVGRFLSALVNANDDNGVVLGKWKGNYAGGVSPNAWNGSGNILAKFAKYKTPVRYGQCWVFCGVLCTVLRACGIPARCITTYNSFHDHDGSMAWEMYFNRFMQPVYFKHQETMWNFHCWNEAWMERKELPPGYGGWQIVDSTPQERSQGFYRCGPASQKAVKEGNVEFPYDSGFVFAEVNADRIFFYQKPRGGFVVGRVDSTLVGKRISCKAVGSNERMDITSSYKYPDNSQIERIIQKKIQMRRRRYRDIPISPVKISIMPPTSISANTDCFVHFKLINTSRMNSRVKFRLTITSVSYRGSVDMSLVEQMYETYIAGQSEKSFREVIRAEKLKQVLWSEMSMIKVDINGLVNEQDFIHEDITFEIDRPRISISGQPSVMFVGQTYRLQVSVMNPFERTLTSVKLYLSGDVLLNGRLKVAVGILLPMRRFTQEIAISSTVTGDSFLYASLSSNEISGFDQYLTLTFQ